MIRRTNNPAHGATITLGALVAVAVTSVHGAQLETDALQACFTGEFGDSCIYSSSATACIEGVYSQPNIKDSATAALMRAAFDADLASLNAALRAGAKATFAAYPGADAIGGDSDLEAAKQVARQREEEGKHRARRNAALPSGIREHLIDSPFDPMKAMLSATFGLTPNSSTILMWAVIGAKKQSCLHDRLGAPPWNGLAVVKRLIANGANSGWQDSVGRSPIAFAISGADPTRPSGSDLEALARILIKARPLGKDDSATLNRWIMLAAARGNEPLMDLLESRGAVPGEEALWRARVRGDDRVARRIEARGVRLDLSDNPVMRERLHELLRRGNGQGLDFAFAGGVDLSYLPTTSYRSFLPLYVSTNVDNPVALKALLTVGGPCWAGIRGLSERKNSEPQKLVQTAKILLDEFRCDPNAVGPNDLDWPLTRFDDSNVELLKTLIEHGAKVGPGRVTQSTAGDSSSNLAATLEWATRNNRPNLAGLIIESHALPPDQVAQVVEQGKVHSYGHNFGELSSIHAAVDRNDIAFVAQWIRERRNVDEEYNDTRFCIHACFDQMRRVTPLMVAADRSNFTIVKMLVEAGADVNLESTYPPFPNMGPLPAIAVFDYAVGGGSVEVVEYLASNPRLKRPPPHLAQNIRLAFSEACRDRRAQEGPRKIAEFLLEKFGPNEAMGHLMVVSASEKCIPLAKRLLDSGAKPDAIALSNAARHGVTELVRLYISMGVPVNEKTVGGTAIALSFGLPLTEAARGHHVETMKVLLDAGSDPDLVDRRGLTPLAAAVQDVPDRDWRPKTESCPDEVAAMQLLLDRGARAGMSAANFIIARAPANQCSAAKRALLESVPP